MKAYKGIFKKKNGEDRTMVFSRIDDLPSSFVASKIQGAGQEQKYPDGMELVWDLESDDFRVFNWRTCEGMPKIFDIEDDLFIDAELQTISKREPTVDYAMEYGEDSEDLQDSEDSQA